MGLFRKKVDENGIRGIIHKLRGDKESQLILLRMTPQEPWKTIIISMVLKEKDVTLNDLEHLANMISPVADLFQQICEKILEIGIDPSELAELFTNKCGDFADWAFREFISRISRRIIGKDHAIRILLRVIEHDPARRKDAWRKIKELDPQRHHLRIVADMEGKIEMNGMAGEAQKLMARLGKRNAIRKAKKIADLIKEQD